MVYHIIILRNYFYKHYLQHNFTHNYQCYLKNTFLDNKTIVTSKNTFVKNSTLQYIKSTITIQKAFHNTLMCNEFGENMISQMRSFLRLRIHSINFNLFDKSIINVKGFV